RLSVGALGGRLGPGPRRGNFVRRYLLGRALLAREVEREAEHGLLAAAGLDDVHHEHTGGVLDGLVEIEGDEPAMSVREPRPVERRDATHLRPGSADRD